MSKKIIVATTAGVFTLSSIGFGVYAVSEPAHAEEISVVKSSKLEDIKSLKVEIDKALDTKDYETWKSVVEKLPHEGKKILEKIDSQEKFDKLVRLHGLRKEAESIEEELNIKPQFKKRMEHVQKWRENHRDKN